MRSFKVFVQNKSFASPKIDNGNTIVILYKIYSLYKDDENTPKIPKDNIYNLLSMATKESFFMLNNKSYKQIDHVAMGSPLDPALANIFMYNFENKWLKDWPQSLKRVFYWRYIDDIFVLFSSLDQAEKFKKYFSSKHSKINFSSGKKNDGSLSFLHINIYQMFIRKRPSVAFILISTASYLKTIKPIWLSQCCSDVLLFGFFEIPSGNKCYKKGFV